MAVTYSKALWRYLSNYLLDKFIALSFSGAGFLWVTTGRLRLVACLDYHAIANAA